jgi:hypothetical protein
MEMIECYFVPYFEFMIISMELGQDVAGKWNLIGA